ncbi:TPA: hypothetical protein U1C36_000370, partial [Streptococcus suis]|nr:hypothetical protein [Streptococcus suis]
MNINLRILWFEDNRSWFDTISKKLTEYARSKNFSLTITRHETVDGQVLSRLLEELIFDIVFVDLNLIGAQKGTTAIEIIRNKNILSDILFYSVRKTDILIKLSDKFFEGIYVCNREAEEFIPKAQDIINKHILKTEDSSSIRGMLMSSVSNFDQKMKSIIIRHLESITFEERKVLDKYASKQVAEYIDYLTKTNESLINTDPGYISSALNRKKAYLLDSDKLARILNKIFEYL